MSKNMFSNVFFYMFPVVFVLYYPKAPWGWVRPGNVNTHTSPRLVMMPSLTAAMEAAGVHENPYPTQKLPRWLD